MLIPLGALFKAVAKNHSLEFIFFLLISGCLDDVWGIFFAEDSITSPCRDAIPRSGYLGFIAVLSEYKYNSYFGN